MPIQVLAGALAIAAAIPLLYLSVSATGTRGLFGRRHNVLGDAPDVRQMVLEKSAWDRVGGPSMRSIGRMLVRVSPQGWIDRADRKLVLAGFSGRLSVEQVMFVKATLAVVLFVLAWLVLVPRVDFGWPATALLTSIGFFAPDAWLSRRADQRQHRIEIELPDVLDQVAMSMNAGLGFEAALARTAHVGEGPLADELSRTAQEIQLGVSRSDALRNLADRTEVLDLKSFVVAVVQSEEYGLGITQVLGVQADELRDKRRQRAEERALKIPVLLIFPLALCIFPTIFIIILGPALIRIYRGMSLIAP